MRYAGQTLTSDYLFRGMCLCSTRRARLVLAVARGNIGLAGAPANGLRRWSDAFHFAACAPSGPTRHGEGSWSGRAAAA